MRAASSNRDEASASASTSTPAASGPYRPVELAYKSFEVKSDKDRPNKSPLLVHHSLLGSKKNFKKVAKEIHHLTKRAVISVDARNHGDSPHSPEMTYTHMANDIRHFVRQMGLDKVAFMGKEGKIYASGIYARSVDVRTLGQTMGGRVGMMLALTQPQLVDKLVCVDATPRNTESSVKRWQQLREACATLKAMEAGLRELTGLQRSLATDKALQAILPDSRDRSLFLMNMIFMKPSATQPASEQVPRSLWRINIDAFLSNPNMSASFPQFPDDAVFEGRALFVSGERSRFTSREDEPLIRRHFPNAKFVWLDYGGGAIQTDRHEEFMKAVVPFLESGQQQQQ